MQILLDDPSQDNYIVIPDNSGIFVIEALEPLFIDTSGTVYLEQDLIVHVGQLVAGSIGRSFGKPVTLTQWQSCRVHVLSSNTNDAVCCHEHCLL